MTSIKYLVQLVFLCFFCVGFAQQTAVYTNEAVDFQSALALYNTQQYQSAQLLFKVCRIKCFGCFFKIECRLLQCQLCRAIESAKR